MDIDTKEIQVVKTQVTKAEQAIADLEIKTDDDLATASDYRTKIKSLQKLIKEKSDSFTRPAYKAYKDIMDSADALDKVVSTKMLTYRKEQEAIAAEEQRKKDEAAKKLEAQVEAGRLKPETAMKKLEAMPATAEVKKSVEGTAGKTTFRTIQDIEITDESAIPDAYWTLDMVKLRADALGNKAKGIAPIAIPGVKVVEKTTLA